MKSPFNNHSFKNDKPESGAKPAAPNAAYQKGDVIGGKYEVRGLLGKGGFGVVYLAYDRASEELCALKTFKDEFLANAASRAAFKQEALLWVGLDEHPFILSARWVEEFSGRLFVKMAYMAPDDEGRVSLTDHLAGSGKPSNVDKLLEWAIQFCFGMEHAVAHGIKCHRDIKPANILIAQDGTLKITDFGLAAAAESAWRGAAGEYGSTVIGNAENGFGLSLFKTDGKGCSGTPGYISPEVYRYGTADIRSDIYSFGLVLWQMATGSTSPPFLIPYRGDMEDFLRGVYRQQLACRLPPVVEPIYRLIERCVKPDPVERYQDFAKLRNDLAMILKNRTGISVQEPEVSERNAAFWCNKGAALDTLGRNTEAIGCYDNALAIDPQYIIAWSNKGIAFHLLDRHEEAIGCFNKALAISPSSTSAWTGKGSALNNLGRREEAIHCYDKALEIDPRGANAWGNKGHTLNALGRYAEAIECYNKCLEINPRNANIWCDKGEAMRAIGRPNEAIACYDKALTIDPLYVTAWTNKGGMLGIISRHEEALCCCDNALAINPQDATTWCNKGASLSALQKHEEAVVCYDKALVFDPKSALAWYNKGNALDTLGRREEAIRCYNQALEINPRYASAWVNKGTSFNNLGRYEEACECYDKVLTIDPQRIIVWHSKGYALIALNRCEEAVSCLNKALALAPQNTSLWFLKAYSEDQIGQSLAAVQSYGKFLELGPSQDAKQIDYARKRIQELGNR